MDFRISPPSFRLRNGRILLLAVLFSFCGVFGCADDVADGSGTNGDAADNQGNNQDSNSQQNDNNDPAQNDESQQNDGQQNNDEEPEETCANLECDQVECPVEDSSTSISGTVSIPSGELPLANVSVYVPNAQLEPLAQGASCQQCAGMISGDPLVETTTNYEGHFHLNDVPVGEDVPLVIQTGKWRRQVEISNIEECTHQNIDEDKTRLPRNSAEGNIPDIAVTTGGYDALQCLIRKIGIDDGEFGTDPHTSSITLYAGANGSDRFADDVNNGESFPEARDWWDDLDALEKQDIIMHSCDYGSPDPVPEARDALRDFADIGGRAFLTDQHRVWLEHGPAEFQSVAQWQPFTFDSQVNALIDTSFGGGETMFDWMQFNDGLTDNDELIVYDIWNNVSSIDTGLTERWIYTADGQQDLYFSFTTPVGAAQEDECGRVVYSDLHMADGSGADVFADFPDGCTEGEMSGQEKALVYLLFDLTACVPADCEEVTCEDIGQECGVHSDGCGGSINCGECCSDIGQDCKPSEDDCCDGLLCDASGTCQVIP